VFSAKSKLLTYCEGTGKGHKKTGQAADAAIYRTPRHATNSSSASSERRWAAGRF
jgi:hypothetical protein